MQRKPQSNQSVWPGGQDRLQLSDLLAELWVARRIFDGSFSELALTGRRVSAFISPTTLVTAKQLHDTTPQARAAIIVGKLDMIRDSTNTCALKMDDDQEVRCTLADKQVGTLTDLFEARVAVSGRAVLLPVGSCESTRIPCAWRRRTMNPSPSCLVQTQPVLDRVSAAVIVHEILPSFRGRDHGRRV